MKSFIESLGVPSGRRLTGTDRIVLIALLLVYSLVAFINLGTLNFPQRAWRSDGNETVIIDLGGEKHVSAIWFNGNIAEGTVHIYDDADNYTEFEQAYGDMFKWKTVNVSLDTEFVRLFVYSGEASFNEVALFDEKGDRIDAFVYVQEDAAGNDMFPRQQRLMDEQSTVPDRPSYFNGMYFDEIYHARTAYEVATDTDLYFEGRSVGVKDFSYVQANGFTIYEWTHPQLGKVLIALGVRLFGMTPFGWRFTGTLFGVLILWVLYVLAKRLFERTDYALLVSGLFGADCMHFAQTRIATIDVYALFFTLLMFLCMLDYLWINRTEAPFARKLVPLGLAGLSFGLGASSKWTCLYSGVGLAVLFFTSFILRCVDLIKARHAAKVKGEKPEKIWVNPVPALPVLWMLPVLYALVSDVRYEVAKSGSGTLPHKWSYEESWYDILFKPGFYVPFFILVALAVGSVLVFRLLTKGKRIDLKWNEQLMTLVFCCVVFILVPALLYYACSYSFYLSENRNTLYEQIRCLVQKQASMYSYHAGLSESHPCQSNWYQWPLAEKSVWFYGGYPDGKLSNISSTGNPVVWYVSAFGAVLMFVKWLFDPACRKNKGFYVILVGILAGLLPWALVTRCVFLYHYFSTIPFVLLAAVMLLYYAEKAEPRLKNLKWIWLGAAVVFFILLYPAVSGLPTSWGYAGFIEHVLTVFSKVYYVGV